MKVSPEALKKLKLFAKASDESLQALCSAAKVVTYPKGSRVFYDKEMLDNVYVAFSGKFCLYKITATSDRRIIFIKGGGTLLNDNLQPGTLSVIYCESFERSTALVIGKQQFLRIMKDDFNITLAVIEQYSSKLRKTYRQLKNALTTVPVDKKIVARLYALRRDFGVITPSGILIDIPITVTNLSEMLGAQRETVSRTLKKLIKEDLIVYKNKRITIRNPDDIVHFYNREKVRCNEMTLI
ncbi:MAG: Crp/Fnr family transcriptional regulator [Defluviitaleaceae bacterium]|nr:Crp/Fnr family transcriptional regulator [Defluviitaleaceae bacterium]